MVRGNRYAVYGETQTKLKRCSPHLFGGRLWGVKYHHKLRKRLARAKWITFTMHAVVDVDIDKWQIAQIGVWRTWLSKKLEPAETGTEMLHGRILKWIESYIRQTIAVYRGWILPEPYYLGALSTFYTKTNTLSRTLAFILRKNPLFLVIARGLSTLHQQVMLRKRPYLRYIKRFSSRKLLSLPARTYSQNLSGCLSSRHGKRWSMRPTSLS